MLILGYPAVPPGPKCDGCIYKGGVGRDWVQPVPQTRPMFTSAPDVLDLEAALPEGEFRTASRTPGPPRPRAPTTPSTR